MIKKKRLIEIILITVAATLLFACGIFALADSVKFKMGIALKPSVYFALSLSIDGEAEEWIFDNRETGANTVVSWAEVKNLTLTLDSESKPELAMAENLTLTVYNYNDDKYMSFEVYDTAGGVLSVEKNGLRNIESNQSGTLNLKTNAVVNDVYEFKMHAQIYDEIYPSYTVFLNNISIDKAYYNEDYSITLSYANEYMESIISIKIGETDFTNFTFDSNNKLTIPGAQITNNIYIISEGVFPTFSVTLNNSDATTAGTGLIYYESGTNAFFTDEELTNEIYSITIPAKTYYNFAGYFTEVNGAGTQYINQAGAFVNGLHKVIGNMTLYAHFTAMPIYTITLDNQSATTAGTTAVYFRSGINEYYSDANCTAQITQITVPARTYYTFGGYYAGTGGSGTQFITSVGVFVNNLYSKKGNATIYAKWTALPIITITLDNQSATSAGTTKIYFRSGYDTYYSDENCTTAITKITVPSKTYKAFGGYYDVLDTGTQYINTSGGFVGNLHTLTSNATLYAKWNDILVKVTLVNTSTAQGASQSISEIYFRSGINAFYKDNACVYGIESIPTPTYSSGLVTTTAFVGYWTGQAGTGTKYIGNEGAFLNNLHLQTNNLTLYTWWGSVLDKVTSPD